MAVSNEIQEQFDNRVVAVFRLRQHLRTILQYLHAFDDVGIDADGARSFGMAMEQCRLLCEEVGRGKECLCALDRSPLLLDIATALEMIDQTLEVGETLARSAMDCGDEDRAIGHIKEAVCSAFEEAASGLNRLTASLLPKELIGRIDAETERLRCEYARLQREPQAGNGDKGSGTEDAHCRHSADYTEVVWFGTTYTFSPKIQAKAIEALWQEWEASGLSLHQQSIGKHANAEDGFRMDAHFRKHPAFGKMIRPDGDGRYHLWPRKPSP